jgi:cytochrome P450
MTYFNYLYSNSQPVNNHSTVTIRPADTTLWASTNRWLKWVVQLPLEIPHKFYTMMLLIRHQEMIAPARRQLAEDRVIHRMASPMGNLHIVTSPFIGKEILRFYRSEREGFFSVDQNADNARLFLPVLQDLVQEPVDLEDFLLTCSPKQAEVYRQTIHHFIGPKNLPALRGRLQDIVQKAMEYLETQEVNGVVHCSARELTGMFTLAVISHLLLGEEAETFSDYRPISEAITVCMNYTMMKFVLKTPTPSQEKAYKEALQVLRDTIDQSDGDFAKALKDTDMTDIQRKGVLFLMYVAGGETSSSLLEYILWQLGQHPDHQTAIVESTQTTDPSILMNRVLREALRLHPSGAFIGRTPHMDLELSVENPDGSRWNYLFLKGQSVLVSPYFAGRSAELFEEPNSFNPDRVESNEVFSVLTPFSRGKHSCPGKSLAQEEIRAFVEELLRRYEVASLPKEEPQQKLLLTLTLDPPVTLILKRKAEITRS